MHLRGVLGNNGHVMLRSGDLHHVESATRFNSLRRVISVLTTMLGGALRPVIGLVLRGSQDLDHMLMLWLEYLRKLSFVDRGRFGLEGEIVRERVKSTLDGDDVDHQMTQANSHHVVSNDRGAKRLSALMVALSKAMKQDH